MNRIARTLALLIAIAAWFAAGADRRAPSHRPFEAKSAVPSGSHIDDDQGEAPGDDAASAEDDNERRPSGRRYADTPSGRATGITCAAFHAKLDRENRGLPRLRWDEHGYFATAPPGTI